MSFKIAMLGLPGAGKGTQSEKLSEEYGIPSVGMGDLLRGNSDAVIHYDDDTVENRDLYRVGGSPLRAEEPENVPDEAYIGDDRVETIGQRLAAGEGPSTQTSTYFLEQRLNQDDCTDGYILDGFPRWAEQADAMDAIDELDAIMYLNVSEDEIHRRLQQRGREDDTPEAIAERIRWQEEGLEEVFAHYEDSTVPIEDINADGTIDEVWAEVQQRVETYTED